MCAPRGSHCAFQLLCHQGLRDAPRAGRYSGQPLGQAGTVGGVSSQSPGQAGTARGGQLPAPRAGRQSGQLQPSAHSRLAPQGLGWALGCISEGTWGRVRAFPQQNCLGRTGQACQAGACPHSTALGEMAQAGASRGQELRAQVLGGVHRLGAGCPHQGEGMWMRGLLQTGWCSSLQG